MELEVNIKASAKEVFDELIAAILEDIKNSTGKKIAIEKLGENYSYKKKLMNYSGSNIDVTVNIDKFIYPNQYIATITNPKGANTIEYSLCDQEDSVNIKYREEYKSKSIFQKLNHMLMSLIFTRSNKKKVIKKFNYLEQELLKRKVKS